MIDGFKVTPSGGTISNQNDLSSDDNSINAGVIRCKSNLPESTWCQESIVAVTVSQNKWRAAYSLVG